MTSGKIDEDLYREIADVIKERRARRATRGKRRPAPRLPIGEGGSGFQEFFRLIVTGNPTMGSFTLNVTLPLGAGQIAIPWNAVTLSNVQPQGALHVETQFQGHPFWQPTYTVTCQDGPFPNNSIEVKFGGDLSTSAVPMFAVAANNLAGGVRTGIRIERGIA